MPLSTFLRLRRSSVVRKAYWPAKPGTRHRVSDMPPPRALPVTDEKLRSEPPSHGSAFALWKGTPYRIGHTALAAASEETFMNRKITRRSAVALAAAAPVALATRGFAQSPIVIKFSHVVANDTPKGKGSLKFKELAEK